MVDQPEKQMSYLSTIHEKVLTLGAGARVDLEIGVADALFFRVFPDGLLASINDLAPVALPEGFLQKGPPGAGIYRALAVINPTAGPLAMRLLYGLGDITVAGAVALIGSVPLPTGAATGAKQDTGNAALAGLVAANADTPKVVNLGASSGAAYAGCKSFALINTGAGDVVITVNGIAGNLPPGYGVDFPLSKPLNLLATVNVATGVGGAALIALTT